MSKEFSGKNSIYKHGFCIIVVSWMEISHQNQHQKRWKIKIVSTFRLAYSSLHQGIHKYLAILCIYSPRYKCRVARYLCMPWWRVEYASWNVDTILIFQYFFMLVLMKIFPSWAHQLRTNLWKHCGICSYLDSVQMDEEAVKDFFFVYGALALLLEKVWN